MELFVAAWVLRLAIVAALAVGGVSWSVGTPPVEAVDRAAAAAFVFTLGGRWFLGWLEPPERRLARLRAERARKRSGKGRGADESTADEAEPSAAPAASATSRHAGRGAPSAPTAPATGRP
ncbi:MAG TPA: hypothetical protein VF763_12985 [Candidatus Limnocylindrales bacterium]